MMVESCTRCKQFVFINQRYSGTLRSKAFRSAHDSHPIEVIDDRELGKDYKNITIQMDRNLGPASN